MARVTVERSGDVGIIRLDDPDTLNAMSEEMIEALGAAFDACLPDSRAIVLTAAGRAFCSGANLSREGFPIGDDGEVDIGLALETHVNPLITKLVALPVPCISAIRGAAAGVGCSLALAADLVVASENAYFLQAFARIGLVPDGGAAWLLTRAVGRARANELMLLGEKLEARQALDWGLINRVTSDLELENVALELAQRLARGPTATYRLIRRLAWIANDGSLAETLAAERRAQRDAGRTHDAEEGIAAFMAKRPPQFLGR